MRIPEDWGINIKARVPKNPFNQVMGDNIDQLLHTICVQVEALRIHTAQFLRDIKTIADGL